MSPISTIPPETLLHIFLFLHHLVDRTAIEAPESPLGAVRLVCRLWDTVVTKTGRFWTTIRLNVAANQNDGEWRTQFSLYLQRSKDLPLDIVLLGRSSVPHVATALKEQVTRWRSVTIGYWGDANLANLDLDLEMPNLIALHVVWTNLTCKPVVLNAPKLQRLAWSHGRITFPEGQTPPLRTILLRPRDPSLPGGRITLEHLSQFKDTLQEYGLATFELSQTTYQQPLTFHRLHTLRLSGTNNDKWLLFMEHCHFPNLHTLEVKLSQKSRASTTLPMWPTVRRLEWRGFVRYVRRCGNSYSRSPPVSPPDELKLFLSACPNILAISIEGDPKIGDDQELNVLLSKTEEGEIAYCKELEEIEGEFACVVLLNELTECRPALKKITMKRWHPDDGVDEDWLEDMEMQIKSKVQLVVLSDFGARETDQ